MVLENSNIDDLTMKRGETWHVKMKQMCFSPSISGTSSDGFFCAVSFSHWEAKTRISPFHRRISEGWYGDEAFSTYDTAMILSASGYD